MRRSFVREAMVVLAAARLVPHRARPYLLRFSGVSVAEGVRVFSGLHLAGGFNLTLEARVFLNTDIYIDAGAPVVIEADCQVADHVRILTSTHDVVEGPRIAGPLRVLPVRIGQGSWLGSGVVVLPGVTIAPRTMVAAGSVVTKDTQSGAVYGGVPARRLREV